jgi:hypothetical protein
MWKPSPYGSWPIVEGGMRRMGENKRGLPEERAHNAEVSREIFRDFGGLNKIWSGGFSDAL